MIEDISSQLDQLAAARAETGAITAGIPATTRGHGDPRAGTPLFDRYATPGSPRCPHLVAITMQPSFLTLPDPTWRCETCQIDNVQLGAEAGDAACGRCDVPLVGEHPLLVLRQDIFVIFTQVCDGCLQVLAQAQP